MIKLQAQSTQVQSWYETMLNDPFAKSFNLEHALVYSTQHNKPRWRSLDYSATVEWSLNRYIDLISQFIFSYALQSESHNTIELRPVVGARFYFTPGGRIETRLLLRAENRNFRNLEAGTWEYAMRYRFRGELIIPINRRSYGADKLWYAMADFERLLVDEEVNERFSNVYRIRLGAGYRLNYRLRFEFLYMTQRSKNILFNEPEKNDNVFRFRFKYYFRNQQDSSPGGTN